MTLLAGMFVVGTATSAQANGNPGNGGQGNGDQDKVTICHRGSDTNDKWSSAEVDKSSIASSGHALTDQHDIIPPFDGFEDGKNWASAGQLIYQQECSTVVDAPDEPLVTEATCEAAGSFVLPEDTVALDWAIVPAYTGPGTYTVSVTAKEPFEFKKPKLETIVWEIVVPSQLSAPACGDGDPDLIVIDVPDAPNPEPATCTADGVFTLPADGGGLDWTETGRVETADGWVVSVTVEPQEGYTFGEGTLSENFEVQVMKQLDADDPACDNGGGNGDVETVDLPPLTWTAVNGCGTYGSVTEPVAIEGVVFSIQAGRWSQLEGVQKVTAALVDEDAVFGPTEGWVLSEDERSATWTSPDLGTYVACSSNPGGGNPPVVVPPVVVPPVDNPPVVTPVKPAKPAAVVSTKADVEVDCDDEEVVTTMTTTTTDWVYQEATNTWVPGSAQVVEAIDTRDATVEECPEVAPVEGEQPAPVKPAKPTKPETPVVEQPDEIKGEDTEKPRVKPVVAQPEALPTAVDAGFGPAAAPVEGNVLGQGMVGGGLLMLLLAGSMQMGRRERGAHEL